MVKETFSPESLENCKFSVKLKNTNIYRSYITAPILKKGGHIEIWSSSLSLICENSFIYYLQHKGIVFIGFPLQHVPFSSFNMATILENGSHLEFHAGYRTFLKMYILNVICANFGACITKWKILMKLWNNLPHYRPKYYLCALYYQD